MRRFAVITLIYLALGFAINFAICWASAAWWPWAWAGPYDAADDSEAIDGRSPSRHMTGRVGPTFLRVSLRTVDWNLIMRARGLESLAFFSHLEAPYIALWPTAYAAPLALPSIQRTCVELGCWSGHAAVLDARGWPCVSFVSLIDADFASGVWSYQFADGLNRGIPLGAPATPWSRILPLRPIVPGLLINTAFYALLCLGLYRGTRGIRRLRRYHKGRCPRCAYDRRHNFDTPCPECGWSTVAAPRVKAGAA
jgi:hypothetical protein